MKACVVLVLLVLFAIAQASESVDRLNIALWESYKYEQGLVSYELGLNEYSDMPHSDFVRVMNRFNMSRSLGPSNRQKFIVPAGVGIPATMDWRQQGTVTPVKNQGYCGSCWAFAAIKAAVATIGPVAVAIDASSEMFELYRGGIYENHRCSSTYMDHAVLVVTEDGKDYWLVKNSWSEGWGDNGYIKMARNRNNQCGIATSATYPLVQ